MIFSRSYNCKYSLFVSFPFRFFSFCKHHRNISRWLHVRPLWVHVKFGENISKIKSQISFSKFSESLEESKRILSFDKQQLTIKSRTLKGHRYESNKISSRYSSHSHRCTTRTAMNKSAMTSHKLVLPQPLKMSIFRCNAVSLHLYLSSCFACRTFYKIRSRSDATGFRPAVLITTALRQFSQETLPELHAMQRLKKKEIRDSRVLS